MDINEFEFPPDQLDDVLPARLSPYSTAAVPPTPEAGLAYPAQNVPLSVLAQMPLDQLPPTQPRNPQNFSIGQVMRGALSAAHTKATAATAKEPTARPSAGVASLPHTPYASHAHTPTHSPYLSAGLPPPPSLLAEDDAERRGGADEDHLRNGMAGEDVHDGMAPTTLRAEASPSTTTVRRFAGRQARIDWSENEVRNFYQALSQFGTDFSAIAVLFPERTRSDIKRLYQRELRQHLREVQQALSQKCPIDMTVFKERYEAKKKEQLSEKTKQLDVEELALVNEIESGPTNAAGSHAAAPPPQQRQQHSPPSSSAFDVEMMLPPAALDVSEATTASPLPSELSAKARKRKRDVVPHGAEEHAAAGKKKNNAAAPQPSSLESEFDVGNETFFDRAMRHDRQDNEPLESFFQAREPEPQEDTDFAFD